MHAEVQYYIVLSIFILIGTVMIAAPFFPNSEVSEQNNKSAFLSLIIIGVIIILPSLIWIYKIFKKTTLADIKDYYNYKKSFRRLNGGI